MYDMKVINKCIEEIKKEDRSGIDISLLNSKSSDTIYIRMRYVGTGTRVVLRISDHKTDNKNFSDEIITTGNTLSYKRLKNKLNSMKEKLKLKTTYRMINKISQENQNELTL